LQYAIGTQRNDILARRASAQAAATEAHRKGLFDQGQSRARSAALRARSLGEFTRLGGTEDEYNAATAAMDEAEKAKQDLKTRSQLQVEGARQAGRESLLGQRTAQKKEAEAAKNPPWRVLGDILAEYGKNSARWSGPDKAWTQTDKTMLQEYSTKIYNAVKGLPEADQVAIDAEWQKLGGGKDIRTLVDAIHAVAKGRLFK
jgi:hypothetical protein